MGSLWKLWGWTAALGGLSTGQCLQVGGGQLQKSTFSVSLPLPSSELQKLIQGPPEILLSLQIHKLESLMRGEAKRGVLHPLCLLDQKYQMGWWQANTLPPGVTHCTSGNKQWTGCPAGPFKAAHPWASYVLNSVLSFLPSFPTSLPSPLPPFSPSIEMEKHLQNVYAWHFWDESPALVHQQQSMCLGICYFFFFFFFFFGSHWTVVQSFKLISMANMLFPEHFSLAYVLERMPDEVVFCACTLQHKHMCKS